MKKPFNRLTNAQAERLALMAEECGEVVQAIGKVLRHGYTKRHPAGGETNRETLERELGDMYASMFLLVDSGDVSWQKVFEHSEDKTNGLNEHRYMHHQKDRLAK